jgi:hypothetical protein
MHYKDGKHPFARAVVIRRGAAERTIIDVDMAADVLLKDMRKETTRRKVAMAACLSVIRGEASAPIARRAFVAAALEAKVLVAD